jgi:hypothetical protein
VKQLLPFCQEERKRLAFSFSTRFEALRFKRVLCPVLEKTPQREKGAELGMNFL